MCKSEPIREEFEEKFPLWAKAILKYCKETQIKSSALQMETVDFSDDLEDGSNNTVLALIIQTF